MVTAFDYIPNVLLKEQSIQARRGADTASKSCYYS